MESKGIKVWMSSCVSKYFALRGHGSAKKVVHFVDMQEGVLDIDQYT